MPFSLSTFSRPELDSQLDLIDKRPLLITNAMRKPFSSVFESLPPFAYFESSLVKVIDNRKKWALQYDFKFLLAICVYFSFYARCF